LTVHKCCNSYILSIFRINSLLKVENFDIVIKILQGRSFSRWNIVCYRRDISFGLRFFVRIMFFIIYWTLFLIIFWRLIVDIDWIRRTWWNGGCLPFCVEWIHELVLFVSFVIRHSSFLWYISNCLYTVSRLVVHRRGNTTHASFSKVDTTRSSR